MCYMYSFLFISNKLNQVLRILIEAEHDTSVFLNVKNSDRAAFKLQLNTYNM